MKEIDTKKCKMNTKLHILFWVDSKFKRASEMSVICDNVFQRKHQLKKNGDSLM